MKKLIKQYMRVSLVLRILVSLGIGAVAGIGLWLISGYSEFDINGLIGFIQPFGNIFIYMLKMIVVPVIFFSLVLGAGSLPLKKFGAVGAKIIGWYLLTSVLAALLGVCLALLINPGSGTSFSDWNQMASQLSGQAQEIGASNSGDASLTTLLYDFFQNPFKALAQGDFLPIIVFSILFGLAVRVVMDSSEDRLCIGRIQQLMDLFEAGRAAMFKIVDWVLEYSPVGVLALTTVNFALHGPKIIGPYISVALGVIFGIAMMVFAVYPLLMWMVIRQHPFIVMKKIRKAIIMAFVTRSSAATLPVSMKVAAEELKIHPDLTSFSLPLGSTINMDGVCVHLPMFAVLSSNLFGFDLTLSDLFVLVITTVLASIGAGGVPGGSTMLLFIILGNMGLDANQISIVVALALGINPVLDMFETMNNVAGDLVCTYTVACKENLLNGDD